MRREHVPPSPRREALLDEAILESQAVTLKLLQVKQEQDALRTETPEILGTAEVASHLSQMAGRDVRPATVAQWRRRGKLPQPIAELASGPIWLKAQFANWGMDE